MRGKWNELENSTGSSVGGQARTLTVKNDVDFKLVILLLTSQCFQNGYLSFELSRSFLYTVYIITELSMICRSTLLGRVKKMPQALDTVRLHQYICIFFFNFFFLHLDLYLEDSFTQYLQFVSCTSPRVEIPYPTPMCFKISISLVYWNHTIASFFFYYYYSILFSKFSFLSSFPSPVCTKLAPLCCLFRFLTAPFIFRPFRF